MDRVLEIDPPNRLADVQAGVVTAHIDQAVAEYGLMYARDPASYRESTIGGNIATNTLAAAGVAVTAIMATALVPEVMELAAATPPSSSAGPEVRSARRAVRATCDAA